VLLLSCDFFYKYPLKLYFSSRNFDKPVTPPLFLPNTMKIKILIIHPALKLGVKLALKPNIELPRE